MSTVVASVTVSATIEVSTSTFTLSWFIGFEVVGSWFFVLDSEKVSMIVELA